MIDKSIVGMGWIKLPKNKYTVLKGLNGINKSEESNCQIELTIMSNNVNAIKNEGI